MFITAKLSVFN